MEGIILFTLLFSLITFLTGKKIISGKRTINVVLKGVSTKLGLSYNNTLTLKNAYLTGNLHGLKITIRILIRKGVEYLHIRIKHNVNVNGRIIISKESAMSHLKKTIGIDDILTGDKRFDDDILIKSSHELYVISILNRETRENFLSLSQDNIIELTDTYFNLYTMSLDADIIYSYASAMITICDDLRKNIPIKKRLIKNIKSRDVDDVIIKNIQALTSHFPIDDEVTSALKRSLKHNNHSVQIESARHLKLYGLHHIMRLLDSPSIEYKSLKKIITLFKDNDFSESIPRLMKLYTATEDKKIKIEILVAFKEFCDSSVNDFLLTLLDNHDSGPLKYIIEALGQCGNALAVEKLYKLAKKSLNPALINAIHKSMSIIQSRMGITEKGWLSVSEPLDGALSKTENINNGALTIIDEKDPEDSP